mgnify:CR=1 FL=1
MRLNNPDAGTVSSWQKANRTHPSKLLVPKPADPKTPKPDERDAPAGMTGDHPSAPLRQAHRDLQRGLQDTDRGPVADRAYKKLKQG